MKRRDVTSREYKVMLQPDRFPGAEEEARPQVDRFWTEVSRLLQPLDIPTSGAFDRVKAHRRIRFFDTVDHSLNGRRYVFRERIDIDTDEREVTLKFRHPDRYVAQDRNMEGRAHGDTRTKFEEDVKPPFVSVFSYSTTVTVDADHALAAVQHVAELFPGLSDELKGVPEDAGLSVVRDFTARELVLTGATMLLGKRDIEAECAMVIWHDNEDPATPPVVAEFSFKYGDDEEDYQGSVARDAHDVLRAIHTDLGDWVHPEPRTKTVFVYE